MPAQEVVSKASALSLGEAIVATASGDVIAAKDMASGVFIEETGQLRVRKARATGVGGEEV